MNIRERLYHDFGIPDQIGLYEKLLAGLKDAGYQFYTVCDFEKVTEERLIDCHQISNIALCVGTLIREMTNY